ncbi:hypothetical protein [Deinococcus budaensis]|uniref:Uncharacterized protein n=1 Tax=Deinococcus budaensis TaxID=1665626 RepID=A0A7W8GEA5_9DEIO|nr:hypothetical protein [Deinococcus budaensis]MBB5233686.1 hypothetical protein [Deinococcus budaensis]
MNVTRHFSDTRTGEGRVRFLLSAGRVRLVAEGLGADGRSWQWESSHATLEDAATFLAAVPGLGQALYVQALDDLKRQMQFGGAA